MEEDREGAALPEAFLEKMERLLGEEYGAFLESLGQERHLALKVNPRKRSLKGAGAASVVAAAFPGLEPVPWAEGGFYYGASCRPGRHPYHQAGLYYIQEPSAMAPVGLLGVQPGDRVLDLCGAPGGKSAQIGAQLQGRGLLLGGGQTASVLQEEPHILPAFQAGGAPQGFLIAAVPPQKAGL